MNETLPQWQRRLTAPDLKGRDLHELDGSTSHMDTCEGSKMPREARVAEAVSDVRASTQPLRGHLPPVREPRPLSDEALELVNGPRQESYGEPVHMHAQVAQVWAACFGWEVDNHKAALAMALVKMVREANKPGADNRLDAIGYIAIAERCVS